MAEPANNFTPRAQQVLALARKEADRFHHNYVGTEHLLLGLIALPQGVAVSVFKKLGLDLETLRTSVEAHVGTGPEIKPVGNIPYTPRVRKVLALAQKEARMLGHSYIGTEHFLLGLLLEGDGVGARVLKSFGVEIDRCRTEILAELAPGKTGVAAERFTWKAEMPAVKAGRPAANPILQKIPYPPSIARRFWVGLRYIFLGPTTGDWVSRRTQSLGGGPYNFTPRAQQVLALARKEADRLHHNYVGTEHLLLGLLWLGQGVAVNALQQAGLTMDNVRNAVEKEVGAGPVEKPAGNIPYTPRVKEILAWAQKEAKTLQHSYVGTEHLLLALLREGEGVATRVFQSFNVNGEKLRQVILAELGPETPGRIRTLDEDADPVRALRGPPATPRIFYSPKASMALARARREADWLRHDSIGTEHVLLALLSQDEWVAGILAGLGADSAKIRAAVQQQIVSGMENAPKETLTYTPKLIQALNLAQAEANDLKHPRVEPRHLLLGLIKEGDGIAARVLTGLGIDYNVLRERCAGL